MWRQASPVAEGIDSAALARVERRAPTEVPTLETLLVVRHGRIIEEREYAGAEVTYHDVQSLTKSVVSLLVGIALHQGAIKSLDQTLADFLSRKLLARLDPRVGRITLKQLLEMRAGFGADDPYATPLFESAPNWMSAILARPLVTQPGTTFAYDGGATHLLSVVLTKAVGLTADKYARERLFRPLGIPDSRWRWERDAQGNAEGPTGLSLRARDMARIGYLLLHAGRWNGNQVVPADYVRDATAMQERAQFLAGGPPLGYGYQFWTLRPEGFAAIGYGGQTIAVFPKLDLVVVTRGSIDAIDPNGLFRLLADVAGTARPRSDRP